MLADLEVRTYVPDDVPFSDLLPYVVDLLDGVSRQINDYRPRTAAFGSWWQSQWNESRQAIRTIRNSELKKLERQTRIGQTLAQTFSSQGYFNGKVINSGDTVTWWQRLFVGGHFDGRDVIAVLKGYHGRLQELIETAESLLDT